MKKEKQLAIVQNLVGSMSASQFEKIKKNVEMYLHDDLSIFVPCLDYCDYAITPRHTHPSYSFIYNYTGPGEIKVHNTIKSSPYGHNPNICAFSPDIPHEEIVKEKFKSYIAVCISKKYFENEMKSYPGIKIRSFEGEFFMGSEMLLNTLKRFIVECNQDMPCKDKLLQAIALEITHHLIRHCYTLSNPGAKVSQKVEINQLVNYLNENYSKKITVEEMARYVNISPSHFSRVFKEETGESPVDFLLNLKVQKAKRFLLFKQQSITEIAFACGFSSASHFSNCFVDRIGIPPSEYRKKQLVM